MFTFDKDGSGKSPLLSQFPGKGKMRKATEDTERNRVWLTKKQLNMLRKRNRRQVFRQLSSFVSRAITLCARVCVQVDNNFRIPLPFLKKMPIN